MSAKTFGKYETIELLGRGGMAEVYQARDPMLGRHVAIKVILPHLAEDTQFDERFLHEAKLIASLRHANIIQLYDFDIQDGQPFMVMEYLDSGTLKDRITRQIAQGQAMSLEEITRILDPLAGALDYAHQLGAIHRDIKPANILFAASGDPVLTDFGIAKILSSSAHITATGGIIGSPMYMSPEQASSKPVNEQSDIYSLGIVVYELATGQTPFRGESVTEILMAHLTEPPPPPREFNPNIPLQVQDVIIKALEKKSEDRFTSAGEFAQAFTASMRGETAQYVSPQAETLVEPTQEIADPLAATEKGTLAAAEELAETETGDFPATTAASPARPTTPFWKKWYAILGGILLFAAIVVGVWLLYDNGVFDFNSSDYTYLYTNLEDNQNITSPDVGIGGFSSLLPSDFVPGWEGNGALFTRSGQDCEADDFQLVSFPVSRASDFYLDIEQGEVELWYQPNYDANEVGESRTLFAITVDGYSSSSVILDTDDGYLSLYVIDVEGDYHSTSTPYRSPIWSAGDWVNIRAIWDPWNDEDSLQIIVNDIRVDEGGVPGGWHLDSDEPGMRIYIGSIDACGNEVADGIIDEFYIRNSP